MLLILNSFLLFFIIFPSAVRTDSYSSYWTGNWQVIHPPTCNTTSCCCFSTTVNVYVSQATSELYLNGTVQGTVCNGGVKQDNVDPPTSLTFSDEFFGIDTYTFTLANSTDLSGLTITAVDNSQTPPKCSFKLYRATTDLLYLSDEPSPMSAPVFPSIGSGYLGPWKFDSTCPVNNDACCCLVGNATVATDPSGAESFYISAPGSKGCRLTGGQLEEDDFPWPLNGTNLSSSVVVNGFLVNQDNYNIVLQQQSNGSATLTFTDLTTPACSMRATRPAYIVFGCSGSLNGTYELESFQTLAAYNYWVEWTNSVRGGIRVGSTYYPVKLIQYNDQSETSLIPSLYQKLTSVDNVTALFSPFGSTLTAVAEQHTGGLPFLFSGSTTSTLYGAIPNAFGLSPPTTKRSVTCVNTMAAAGVKTVSVISTFGDVFNGQASAEVMKNCNTTGITILSNDTFVSGSTNFTAFISKWQQLNPDLLVISATAPDPWNIIKAVRVANWWPRQIYMTTASSLASTITEAIAAGEEWMVEFLVSSDTWRPDQAGTDPYFGSPSGFAAAYLAATKQEPVSTYVSGFAAGYALTVAIETAGSLKPASIISALQKLNITFWYGTLTFGSNGAALLNYTCIQVFNTTTRTITPVTSPVYIYPSPQNAPPGFYSNSPPPPSPQVLGGPHQRTGFGCAY